MGFLSRLFGGNQSNAVEQVRSQPEGFYIVKYEYGEGQARSLFQKAEAGDVNAQLTIAKCFMDVAEHHMRFRGMKGLHRQEVHRLFMNLHIFMREGTLESKQILRKRNKFAERLLK